MPAEPKHTRCDECGMEFQYICCREIYCPGCNHWTDYGHECDCDQCRADDTSDAAIQRIALAVQIPAATVHAVLEMLAASTS